MVVGRFGYALVGTMGLMIVNHDNGSDNVASPNAGFKVRDERPHRRLQSLGPVPIATMLGRLVEGLEKLRWQRHTDPAYSLIIHQIVTRLAVILNPVESAKSITNSRLYITTLESQVETACQYSLRALKALGEGVF